MLSNTFFVLAVCGGKKIFSNFLKFSRRGGGARSGGVVGYIFSIGIFVGNFFFFLKFSQIFSNFLGIHFYVLAFWENFLKFSQIFSNFLKISQKFQLILNKIFVPNDVGWGADWVGGSRLGSGMPDTVLVFDYFLGKLSHLFQSSALWG